MPTFNNGESGSSVRGKINSAITKAELAVKPYDTRTEAVSALSGLSSDISIVRWLDDQGDVVEIVRDAGSTEITDIPGWRYFGLNDAPTPFNDLRSAASLNEAQIALGLGQRVVSVSPGSAAAYVANADNYLPAIHSVVPSAASFINIDASGLAPGRTYRFVNNGAFGTTVFLNVDGNKYFKTNWSSPNATNLRSFSLVAGEAVTIFRLSSVLFVAEKSEMGLWVQSGYTVYRRELDGTYRFIYTRTFSISGLAESTANTLPTGFNLNSARVESVVVTPAADGSPPPDLPPQVTKLGATHGLAANRFAIRNPNAEAITHPIRVVLSNVSGG